MGDKIDLKMEFVGCVVVVVNMAGGTDDAGISVDTVVSLDCEMELVHVCDEDKFDQYPTNHHRCHQCQWLMLSYCHYNF